MCRVERRASEVYFILTQFQSAHHACVMDMELVTLHQEPVHAKLTRKERTAIDVQTAFMERHVRSV